VVVGIRQVRVGESSDEPDGIVVEVLHHRLVHPSVGWVVDGLPVDGLEAFDVIGDID
jgi:hypothetical protein